MSAAAPSVCIERLTWPKVQALQASCPLLVLPLGATEQHGSALPIHTDTVIADALVEKLELAKTEQAPLPEAEWAGVPDGFYN